MTSNVTEAFFQKGLRFGENLTGRYQELNPKIRLSYVSQNGGNSVRTNLRLLNLCTKMASFDFKANLTENYDMVSLTSKKEKLRIFFLILYTDKFYKMI